MTNETIELVIDNVNDGSGTDRIFLRPLIENVTIAKVWPEYPKGVAFNEAGYDVYFVYSDDRRCVAAILDMGPDDLHVFVKQESRRQGIMTRALRDVVLPHLLRNRRTEQRVTFNSMESRGLLQKAGFTITDDGHAVITAQQCEKVNFVDAALLPFLEDRKEALKKRLGTAAGLMKMACEEMELILGSDELCLEIEATMDSIWDIRSRVEDAWWAKGANKGEQNNPAIDSP